MVREKHTTRRKVLFLIPTLEGGGAERVITTLVKHLDRSKFSITLAVVNTRKSVFRDEIPCDIEFIDLKASRVRYAIPKVISLIWKQRPDIVFSTLGHLNLALAIIRPLLPKRTHYIARETTIVSYGLQRYTFPKVWIALYRSFYKNFDMVVCQSHFMQKDLSNLVALTPQQLTVINNPVDTDRIQQLCTQLCDSSTLFPPNSIKLIAAGRMADVKGFDLLIEAIALVNDKRIHLVILGEGPLQEKLQNLAKFKGLASQIKFAGFQKNPYPWFFKADVFILSSRFEGFPNVVLEALACGTPVIATPAPGGVREILKSIPECLIAESITAQSIADAINQWLNTPQRKISKSFVAPYEVKHILKRYEELLLTIAR